MQGYILSMSDADYSALKERWIRNWDIDIDAEYGSRERFAAEIKEDECWLNWQEDIGGTPAEYLAL